MKAGFSDILRDLDRERERKIAAKLPAWAGVSGLQIPSALALEQCSSSATARYKASLVSGTLADLTGGLGVDSAAFAARCTHVYYYERDAALAEAARHNFAALGLDNVDVRCEETRAESIRALPACDWLYLDPARRDAGGRKVFRLSQCSPDVTALLPVLCEKAPRILLKLSPMADVTQLARELGTSLREVHLVEWAGECKEVLCLLDMRWKGAYTVVVTDLQDSFRFLPAEETAAEVRYAAFGEIREAPYLFEPGPALMKSGAYRLLCGRFGLRKLDPMTQLYLADAPVPLGRCRRIEAVFPLKPFSAVAARYPAADISVRNLPISAEQLRARLGVVPGGDIHLYGCTAAGSKCLIATRQG
ncbi:MAG: SAM-dependent methyltransferase [Bacteroidales bacterium]|nr:SAM-dependent methyltransferase [Bacteroidales bacterium]